MLIDALIRTWNAFLRHDETTTSSWRNLREIGKSKIKQSVQKSLLRLERVICDFSRTHYHPRMKIYGASTTRQGFVGPLLYFLHASKYAGLNSCYMPVALDLYLLDSG